MKKRICKHKAIAKGNGERYWKCIFCGQKVADPAQLTNKKMRNKNQKENWRKRFDKKFSLSDFWLNPNNYPKNYRDIIAFIEKERKIVEDNTLKHIEEDYQEFIKEIRQEEKEKWLNLTLERIEKIKPPVMKEEYFRELPSLK